MISLEFYKPLVFQMLSVTTKEGEKKKQTSNSRLFEDNIANGFE